jgi:ATP-dependent RNA helicase DeaD
LEKMTTVLETLADTPSVDEVVFRDFPLSDEVQLSIQMTGYTTPTSIQAEIIPLMLEGRDVLAQSQTGTGKTAAFALPILSRLDFQEKQTQVLVLTPTRELATQVAKSFETYASCLPQFRVAAIYGGADYDPQLRLLKRGVQVVVGTPGRVIDHIKRGTLKLDAIKCFVLDEADEMLNMGFIEDIEFVLSQAPQEKQVALFSATMPEPIRRIADKYLTDPATITIRRKTLTAESIEQKCVFVHEGDKRELLARMLEIEDTDGVIVFTKTKDSTMHVADHLCQLGFSAAALNGDLPQARRQRTVDQLKSGQLNIIVATDVAARGLDVQRISHVFNYDLPHDSESYVHRIGRTGRAGRKGVAVIFLTPPQRGKLRLIERATKQMIEVVELPGAREINQMRISRFKQQIGTTITAEDLSFFKKLIAETAEETEQPMEVIAAALAHLAQGGRPLLVKDIPLRQTRDRFERNDAARGGRDARPGRREFDSDSRRPRNTRPPEHGKQRYRIEVGRDDGVRPGNIVGAIANEAGINGSDIGPIDIHGNFSTIDLPANLPAEAIATLKKTWVSGKQLQIRTFSERDESNGGSYDSRPPRSNSGNGKTFARGSSKAQGSRTGAPKPNGAKPAGFVKPIASKTSTDKPSGFVKPVRPAGAKPMGPRAKRRAKKS